MVKSGRVCEMHKAESWQQTRQEYGDMLIAKGKATQARAEKYRLAPGHGGPIYAKQGERLNALGAYTISEGLAIKTGVDGSLCSGSSWGNPHKTEVIQALRDGKPVPKRVLAGYPELDKERR